MPVRILSGIGRRRKTTEKIIELEKTRPLIVTDKDLVKAGRLDLLTIKLKSIQNASLVFDYVGTDSPDSNVEKVVEIARKGKVDLLIGIGRGSSIDVAKAFQKTVKEYLKMYASRGAQKFQLKT